MHVSWDMTEASLKYACKRDMTEAGLKDACKRDMTEAGLKDACKRDMTEAGLKDACKRDMTEAGLKEDNTARGQHGGVGSSGIPATPDETGQAREQEEGVFSALN